MISCGEKCTAFLPLGCQKPLLLREDILAAGELEGARPASSWIIAIKNA